MTPHIASHVRFHRRKSGLSQGELAEILGSLGKAGISRHERVVTLPKFLVAVGYEVVFRVPVADLFPGVYETVELGIETRLSMLEQKLHESSVKGREAALIARKLEWLWERKNSKSHFSNDESRAR
jgi:DNA-binding XRE family transcriptional regulator